jgi:predicted nucleic acid-binding Zn ribbon protein
MTNIYVASVGVYLCIAAGLLVFGPYRARWDLMFGGLSSTYKLRSTYFWKTILGSAIVWPFTLRRAMIDRVDLEALEREMAQRTADARAGRRTLRNMGGTQHLICSNCNTEQRLVGFLHNLNEATPWCIGDYQCQECGQFARIEEHPKDAAEQMCACGGELRRDKFIFCPRCRGNTFEVTPGPIT